jgi:hypothetical protein
MNAEKLDELLDVFYAARDRDSRSDTSEGVRAVVEHLAATGPSDEELAEILYNHIRTGRNFATSLPELVDAARAARLALAGTQVTTKPQPSDEELAQRLYTAITDHGRWKWESVRVECRDNMLAGVNAIRDAVLAGVAVAPGVLKGGYSYSDMKDMLYDVVDALDLSESMLEKHGPNGTKPAELVREVLAQKDKQIQLLERGFVNAAAPRVDPDAWKTPLVLDNGFEDPDDAEIVLSHDCGLSISCGKYKHDYKGSGSGWEWGIDLSPADAASAAEWLASYAAAHGQAVVGVASKPPVPPGECPKCAAWAKRCRDLVAALTAIEAAVQCEEWPL